MWTRILSLVVMAHAAPLAFVQVAHAQVPAGKTPAQAASPFVDTLAARLTKLVREAEAAGDDFQKVRELEAAFQRSNEKLNAQLEGFKAQMDDAGRKEYDVYVQMRIGKLPAKLAALMDKAKAAAAAKAASAGPAAVARFKAAVGMLAVDAELVTTQLREAGGDAAKREAAWKAALAWDQKRHQLLHAVHKDADIASPEPLLEEAEATLHSKSVRLDRLHRLLSLPPCPVFQAELAAAEARVKTVAELEGGIKAAKSVAALAGVQKQREAATNAALEANNPELTADEAAEVLATTQEWLDAVGKKLDEATEKTQAKLRKSE